MNSAIEGPQTSTVLIAPEQEADFLKRLDALNKKGNAFGLTPIVVISKSKALYERHTEQVGRAGAVLSYLTPVNPQRPPTHLVQLLRIEIEYPIIKLGNWLVVAKLERLPSGTLQFLVTRDPSDASATAAYASQPVLCEHCNLKRHRKEGYVLRNLEDGGHMQVGANCLQDFTGTDPAAALFMARMWDVFRFFEEDLNEFGRSGRCNAVYTRDFLADVSFLAKNYGFVSASTARERGIPATYEDAMALGLSLREDEGLRTSYRAQIESHRKVADEVLAWVAQKSVESTFDSNLKLLLSEDALSNDRKHLAFAAAAVAMFHKATAEAQSRADLKHVGLPGQKMTTALTVHRTILIETAFGPSTLVLLRDADGNHLTWKTAACPRDLIENEEQLRITASFKVKKHDLYKNVPQTQITHLKVVATPVASCVQ